MGKYNDGIAAPSDQPHMCPAVRRDLRTKTLHTTSHNYSNNCKDITPLIVDYTVCYMCRKP